MSHLNCWVILERKAHDQVRDLQKDLAATQAKAEHLQATLDKLTGMYAEYQAAEEAGGKQMGLSGSMNQRQFMAQLLTLRERIERDLAHQQGVMAQQRTRLIKAEAERMKMQALVDQQELIEQKSRELLEQKQMDDLGVRRFNLRTSH
jgi:flagellar export protein FliJ